MKSNAPKRKVFQDAVDLISPETVNAVDVGQTMIFVEKIVPFHNHPFRLYEGKRLDDMVESIKEHGILIPVIVQKIADGYEMLSGHNRWNAANIAGIKEIPAIVKENLTEREAYVYVIETNMLQRSFDDLLPSEKAAVLAERYEKVMCQGRRNDILEEIARLNGVDASETCGHDVHKSKSRDAIGEDYGMTGRNIARYMRLNQTTDQIKQMVDDGTMAMVTAVELSYLSEEEQKQVCSVMEEHGGNRTITEVVVVARRGDFYTVRFLNGGAIQLRRSRIFPTREEAEEKIPVRAEANRRFCSPYDYGM